MIRLSLGDLQLWVLDEGRLSLDGGAMFGASERPAGLRARAWGA